MGCQMLLRIFDDLRQEAAKHLYEHSFSEHTLKVTHIVTGYGGCNAIIVSASEDRTCKVWVLSVVIAILVKDLPCKVCCFIRPFSMGRCIGNNVLLILRCILDFYVSIAYCFSAQERYLTKHAHVLQD